MSTGSSRGGRFRRLTLATALATYLLIVWGGVVRVTGSGLGCGDHDDWPLCQGGLLPPLQQAAVIEFTHRWLAAIATTLVVVLAFVAWIRRSDRHLARASLVVVLFFVLQIVLGAMTVKLRLPGEIVLIHLANALLLLGALLYIAVSSHRPRAGSGAPGPNRWADSAAAATFVLVLSGALVVADGAGASCAGWPLCGGGFQLASRGAPAINLLHRIVAGVVVLFVGMAMARVRRDRSDDRAVRRAAMATNVAILVQVLAGAAVVTLNLPAWARGIHLALASALWALTLTVALLCRTANLRTASRPAGADLVPPVTSGALAS